MTLKYESEVLFELMKRDGDDAPSDVLPYESELKEKYLNQVAGAYPKLQDYRPEWLYYNLYHHLPSDFPVESVANVTSASFNNVVPYAYRSAILKGSTKYRDIDTGEVLDAFEDGRNLELVSVKMPVLKTTGKNLLDGDIPLNYVGDASIKNMTRIEKGKTYTYSNNKSLTFANRIAIRILDKNGAMLDSSTTPITIVRDLYYNSGAKCYTPNADRVKTDSCFISNIDGYVRFGFFTYPSEENRNLYFELQLEEGSVATSYEPFKSNILTANEDVTLRGIGNVVDELDLNTGELTQKVENVLLTGDEVMELWTTTSTEHLRFFIQYEGAKEASCICNKFINFQSQMGTNSNFESIASIGNGFTIVILKNRLNQENVNGFKQWLKDNLVFITYQLEQEVNKTVDLSCINEQGKSATFRPIEGTMHVNTSSQALPPLLDMSVPVEATTQNLMSFANIEEEE